jgi:ribonuclease VapC
VIVDTSAVVAVIKGEHGWEEIERTLVEADAPRMSAGTYQELAIVVDRVGDPSLSRQLDQLLASWGVVVEPVTAELARVARDAYRDFGRGSGHRARLNFGDCFAYALASRRGEPLLFVGDDFSATDVVRA